MNLLLYYASYKVLCFICQLGRIFCPIKKDILVYIFEFFYYHSNLNLSKT